MKKILCFWIFNILFVHLAFANGNSHADLGNLQMGETAEFQIELYNDGEDDLIFHFFYTSGFSQLKVLSDLPLTLYPVPQLT
ncbi:MAG TPA: hypothetical protein VK921_10890 [Anditalea sp.]|nr:hypothetical protein [Anditalea sp.]